jgi:hypothetical protein
MMLDDAGCFNLHLSQGEGWFAITGNVQPWTHREDTCGDVVPLLFCKS